MKTSEQPSAKARDRRVLYTILAFSVPACIVLFCYTLWFILEVVRPPMWSLAIGWVLFTGGLFTVNIWRKDV